MRCLAIYRRILYSNFYNRHEAELDLPSSLKESKILTKMGRRRGANKRNGLRFISYKKGNRSQSIREL